MMTHKKIIDTLRRPLAKILQDLERPIPSEMLEQKPTYNRGQKTGEVSYVPWYNCIQLLMRYCPGYDFEIRTQSFGERIIVEGRLNLVMTKLTETSETSIAITFLVVNLSKLLRQFCSLFFSFSILTRTHELNHQGCLNKTYVTSSLKTVKLIF